MGIADLQPFVGEWEQAVDLPGAADARGAVSFERLGDLLVQRSSAPGPVPDALCVIEALMDGGYRQHYFDSRGVVRLYDMTFDARTWTLLRATPDFSPLSFQQRYLGRFSDDHTMIEGEWQTSEDGDEWRRDFGLVYRRIGRE